jgi:hypothetical protein
VSVIFANVTDSESHLLHSYGFCLQALLEETAKTPVAGSKTTVGKTGKFSVMTGYAVVRGLILLVVAQLP